MSFVARARISQIVSTFDGTFTAGPWIDLCLPDGRATIFMNGTRRVINLNSNGFRPDSSGGISDNCNPLAFACSGREPLDNALSQVLQIHSFPSLLST